MEGMEGGKEWQEVTEGIMEVDRKKGREEGRKEGNEEMPGRNERHDEGGLKGRNGRMEWTEDKIHCL